LLISEQRKLKEALETTAFEMSQFKERLKAVNTTKNATENARNLVKMRNYEWY